MPLGDGSEYRSASSVGNAQAALVGSQRCTCPPDLRTPLSKIDRSDPILRSYLAPPAEPHADATSPLATSARRESAGVGFAIWAFSLLILIIVLGDLWMALGISVLIGLLVYGFAHQRRLPGVRADEARLRELAERQRSVYEARRAAWERLSYCPTHHCVIDERTGDTRPLYAAHELLVLSTVVPQATVAPAEQ